MTLRTLLLLGAAGLAHVRAEELLFCGSAPYYASEYTCYDNNLLCPRLHGQPTLPCGGACYSPDMYRCEDGQLQLLPTMDSSTTFKLQVHSANPVLSERPVEVCGLQFHVGPDSETCVYCYNAPPLYVCDDYENETVLLPGGAMSVDVPGGQHWFIDQTTGRLRATAGGRGGGEGRDVAGEGVTVYHEGYFAYDHASYWLACHEDGDRDVYGIFAPIAGVDETGCERVKLSTVISTDPNEGAYSYT